MLTRTLVKYFILISILYFSSCEGFLNIQGTITSNATKAPLDSVLMYIPALNASTYTDSAGRFKIYRMYGCVFTCPEIELVLYKPGYQLGYYNYTKSNTTRREGFLFQLNAGSNSGNPSVKPIGLYVAEAINFLMVLFNVFTFLFLLRSRVKFRAFLLLCLLVFNFELQWSYFVPDFRFGYFEFFFHLSKLLFHTTMGWYQVFIPFFSLVFWAVYYWKRDWLMKEG